MKLTAEGVKPTAKLTENYAEKGKPGNIVINDNGKHERNGNEMDSNSNGSTDDSDDTSSESVTI